MNPATTTPVAQANRQALAVALIDQFPRTQWVLVGPDGACFAGDDPMILAAQAMYPKRLCLPVLDYADVAGYSSRK